MPLPNIRIVLSAANTAVYVDDKLVPVTHVAVDAPVGDLPRVTLTVPAARVTVEGNALVARSDVPDGTCPQCKRTHAMISTQHVDGERLHCYYCGHRVSA